MSHDMGEAAGLQKDGVERDLQLLLADHPEQIEEGLRLVKREWSTDVGPVDLMCRDAGDGWVAVEIKRIGTIDAVEQLSRYLDCIRVDSARAACRGVLAAQTIKPQAVALADSRGIGASRSISRCCAASASPSSRCSPSSARRTCCRRASRRSATPPATRGPATRTSGTRRETVERVAQVASTRAAAAARP